MKTIIETKKVIKKEKDSSDSFKSSSFDINDDPSEKISSSSEDSQL